MVIFDGKERKEITKVTERPDDIDKIDQKVNLCVNKTIKNTFLFFLKIEFWVSTFGTPSEPFFHKN